MAKKEDIYHSILIVSSSGQFDALVRKSLAGFMTIDIRKSAAMARRCILERYYDLVVVNSPLPDENGEEFCMDVTEKCGASVLLVTPQNVYEDVLEQVTDHGVLVIEKPSVPGRIDKAIRFLVAIQNRMHRLEKKTVNIEEKMEEIRIVSRAKILLVEKKEMTEDEAHRYIGKQAMGNGISRKRAAEQILEDLA
ncbi:MAG: ANTAR domain-containing protein [Lachnospiraceae bacterium]|nr:ANTAR domain-containing protein [Lachnospiraceae bacterium]